jgi:ubiquinone/menaquinone biosynthesis C-methylase UbiE
MFNRKAARRQSKANEIIKVLNIQPGQTIADIGSGGGFFAFLFSQQVGEKGKVYAIDTNQDFLEFINKQASKQGITNVTTIHTTEQSIPLLTQPVDLLFVRSVYHHLQNRTQYFLEAKKLFASQGRIAIIEFSQQGSKFSFHRRCGHNVPKEIIIEEMTKAGYIVSESFDFLPVQSFTIFRPIQ